MTITATEPTTTIDDLLEEVEIEARNAAKALENAGKLPTGFTATYYPLTPREQQEGRRVHACWMLATGPDTLRALLNGEAVPRHRIRTDYLALLERWPQTKEEEPF